MRARYLESAVGRFLSRDVWERDPNRPTSFNAWLYVASNPVNLTDPTGEAPTRCQSMPSAEQFERCVLDYYHLQPAEERILGEEIDGTRGCYHGRVNYRTPGYIEGIGGFLGTTWAGAERVYSFASMERVDFWYLGFGVSDSVVGAGMADYAGVVFGLRSDMPLSETYRGLSLTGQGGASIPLRLFFGGLPGSIGDGITLFRSIEDPRIKGATFYVGGTLAQDVLEIPFAVIDAGAALVQYSAFAGSGRLYADSERGQVNTTALLADILTSSSIWVEPFYPFMIVGRGSAAAAALYYSWVYEELAALDQ